MGKRFAGTVKQNRKFTGKIFLDYIIPDEPIIPDTAMYLYGTPAPSVVTYNGVELPDIEAVWTDKETYPYAWITNVQSTDYWTLCTLTLSNKAAVYTEANGVCIPAPYSCQIYGATLEVTEAGKAFLEENGLSADDVVNAGWSEDSNQSSDNDSGHGVNPYWTQHGVAWTSHDILNSDGTTYLAASEPVYTQSGNIGLRVAGDMVKYGGVELPDIESVWDKEKYPYALIHGLFVEGIHALSFCGTPYYADRLETIWSDGKTEDYMLCETQELADSVKTDLGLDIPEVGKWCRIQTGDEARATYYDEKWTSHDILNTDGSIYLAATEPEPVQSVKYYNGCVRPALPEVSEENKKKYPYLFISSAAFNDVAMRWASMPTDSDHGYGVDKGAALCCRSNFERTEWGDWAEETSYFGVVSPYWGNTDLYTTEGELSLQGTDPIPVGEIVDTINGVPIYEVI